MELNEEQQQLRRRKLEEALEVKSLRRIISAYINYPDAAEDDIKRCESSFRKLSPAHKTLLLHLPSKFQSLRRCISVNTFFILNMLQAFEPPLDMSMDVDNCEDQHLECCPDEHHHRHDGSSLDSHHSSTGMARSAKDPAVCNTENDHMPSARGTTDTDVATNAIGGQETEGQLKSVESNGNASSSSCDWLNSSLQLNVPLVDVDKVRCVIRNIVRDWGAEGQVERDQCYLPILEELERLFPKRSKESPPCCLVPGAGLGRLALDISRLGFVCQGNEFSYYMMICSSFILNHSQSVGEWTIYPWIHSNCNSISDEDQLRPVSIPDILPASVGITEGFSMCGGDFVEVYSDPGQEGIWDAVVTCFFIDTAHNIVEYIEIIWKILKDGGVWINLGPLLYHFADTYGQNEMSIELSLEDVKKVAFHYGFTLEKESTISTTYTTNARSMMQNRYFAAFWTMRKKSANKSSAAPDE
ncbi:carnosine N-methyltransferase-like [Chenopodium quinoa]|uniref:carnosine N-methyltransferase-like n=1 Tax=Chenopodium quinoa TaxID=63459 RepID=UPI000B78CBC7|nr:carnosine N-methyltransferase-like [Chenopodium quinoa]